MLILVMGVSGSGKTTVGRTVAAQLDATFLDADDFHAAASIEKMRTGVALTDDDRRPWIDAVKRAIDTQRTQSERTVVLACSALTQWSRDRLLDGIPDAHVFWLDGPRELIASRMRTRKHFMPEHLLDSQFETLEAPQQAMRLSLTRSAPQLAVSICEHLQDR